VNTVTSASMIQFLIDSTIPIRLSCLSLSNWPVVVSLLYFYENKKFYCATQNTSKIVKYIQKHPRCGFEVARDSLPYRGVRGYGIANILEGQGEEILRVLLEKYFKGKQTSRLHQSLLSKNHLDNEVAIEVTPVRLFEWDYRVRMSDLKQLD
jgi:nitroimidazol reductase NimA-like FMN-containing flavoprotein (pyridoxamine 5'-phosphate oxidase superfamily)